MKINHRKVRIYAVAAVLLVAAVFVVLWVVRIFKPADVNTKEVKAELGEIKTGLKQVGEGTKAILESAAIIHAENERIRQLLESDNAEAEKIRAAQAADNKRTRQTIDELRAGYSKDQRSREEIKRTSDKYPPLLKK